MQPARAMELTACATAQPGAAKSELDGVAGGGCGALAVFDPRGATAPEGPQDEERGDGQGEAARDRERSCHAAEGCVDHLTEPEAETQAGEAAPGRRERHDGEVAGLAQACPSGTTHREAHAYGGSVLGPRVYRVREGRVALCHRAGERDLSGREVRWTRELHDVLGELDRGRSARKWWGGRERRGSAGHRGRRAGLVGGRGPSAVGGAGPAIGLERTNRPHRSLAGGQPPSPERPIDLRDQLLHAFDCPTRAGSD